MKEFDFYERRLIQDIIGEHLDQVESGSIVYGDAEMQGEIIEVLKGILAKVG